MLRQAKSDLGPADIAHLLKAQSGLSREDVLRLFGLRDALPRKQDQVIRPDPVRLSVSVKSPEVVLTGFRPKYWQLCSLKKNQTTQSEQKKIHLPQNVFTLDSAEEIKRSAKLPSPDLLSKERLWSRACEAAQRAESLQQAEVRQWVHALARAKVPRKSRAQEAIEESGEIWLVIDYHPRLMLWWDELNRVSRFLSQRFGQSRARVIPLLEGDPLALLQPGRLPWPDQKTRILVFSDVGFYAELSQQAKWQSVMQHWQDAAAQTTVFLPCSQPPATKKVLGASASLFWDERTQSRGVTVLESLLACLSMVQWCSPALLRVWRRRLGGQIEHEYQLWHHAEVWSQPGACGLEGGQIEKHRRDFQKLDASLQQVLLHAAQVHRQCVSTVVKGEEAANAQALGLPVAQATLETLRKYTLKLGAQRDLSFTERRWLWRLSERQCESFWQANPALEHLCFIVRSQTRGDKADVPLGPGMKVPARQMQTSTVSLSLQVLGDGLQLVESDVTSNKDLGTELLQIPSGLGGLYLSFKGAKEKPRVLWRKGHRRTFTRTKFEHLSLASNLETLTLRQTEKPDFATSIEQGPKGLYCTLPEGRRLRWCYPGEASSGLMHPLTAPEGTVKATWVDEAQWELFQSPELPYLPKEARFGQDDFGCYAEFAFQSESLKMRWIPPGTFWMGSPENEAERGDNEKRHKVMLTQGYWLSETVCTQNLWKVVTGKSPSYFFGEDLPVEIVSWDDVQGFCDKLIAKIPGFGARMPSEAEWEYACRAGTKTAFWWGETLTTELANYNGHFSYNNGREGEYRKITLTVKNFRPNPWGLYQMYGNVWEWCEDGYGRYSQENLSLDPIGFFPDSGRVLRGGGWNYGGGWLRTAIRYDASPHKGEDGWGFRLSAGPLSGGAAPSREADV